MDFENLRTPHSRKWAKRALSLRVALYEVKAFYYFSLREMNSTLMGVKNSYKEAQDMSSFLSCICDREVRPEEFIHNDDELSDEALDNHSKYKECLDSIAVLWNGCPDKGTFESLFKMLYYNPPKGMWTFRMYATTDYMTYVDALSRYIYGTLNEEQLKLSFVDFSPFTLKVKPSSRHKVRLFIKQLFLLIELTKETARKRDRRKAKKILEFDESAIS